MAIALPSAARIVRHDLRLATPGRVPVESLYGPGRQVLERGPGRWEGVLVLGVAGAGGAALRAQIEAWVSAWHHDGGAFEIPAHRAPQGTLEDGDTPTVATTSASGRYRRITLASVSTRLPAAGDFLQVTTSPRRRMFQVALVSGSNLDLMPNAAISAADAIAWQKPVFRALLADLPELPYTPDFAGPWSLSWEEVV